MRLENLNAFLEAVENLGRAHPIISRRLAGLIREKAYEIAPRRAGRLRKSIGVRRTRVGYEVVMGGSEAPYASFVEFGTRPHLIRARRARALRFQLSGEVVYARYVRHPGSKPKLILARAVSEALREMGSLLDEVLGEL